MFLQIEFKIALEAPFKRLANAFKTECLYFLQIEFKIALGAPFKRMANDFKTECAWPNQGRL